MPIRLPPIGAKFGIRLPHLQLAEPDTCYSSFYWYDYTITMSQRWYRLFNTADQLHDMRLHTVCRVCFGVCIDRNDVDNFMIRVVWPSHLGLAGSEYTTQPSQQLHVQTIIQPQMAYKSTYPIHVGYQRADLTNGHTDGKGTCPWSADFFSFWGAPDWLLSTAATVANTRK